MTFLRVKFKNQTVGAPGVTIIELTIAIGVFAVVLMGVLSGLNYVNVFNQRSHVREVFNNLSSKTMTMLDGEETCTPNLQGQKVNGLMQSGALKNAINSKKGDVVLRYVDLNGKMGEPILQEGAQVDGKIQVERAFLTRAASMDNNLYLLHLNVLANVINGDSKVSFSERFPILVETDNGGTIVNCFGHYSMNGVSDINARICDLSTGGEYYYNPKTNECEERFVRKCFPGGNTKAQCGIGAVSLYEGRYMCDADNVSDPMKKGKDEKRKFVNGKTKKFNFWPSWVCRKQDDVPLGVECVYAEGTSYGSATCSACCNVDKLVYYESNPQP